MEGQDPGSLSPVKQGNLTSDRIVFNVLRATAHLSTVDKIIRGQRREGLVRKWSSAWSSLRLLTWKLGKTQGWQFLLSFFPEAGVPCPALLWGLDKHSLRGEMNELCTDRDGSRWGWIRGMGNGPFPDVTHRPAPAAALTHCNLDGF